MPQPNRALIVTGIYTLTPTHCGTGQAAGAVDLPIAREAHSTLPILPATTIKGIARDEWFDRDDDEHRQLVKDLFGPPPPRRRTSGGSASDDGAGEETEQSLSAGDLMVFDGLLLAFPVRSLTDGFRLVTSPLLLKRLDRIARSFDAKLALGFVCPDPPPDGVLLPADVSGPVSLEDLVFAHHRCRQDPAVTTLAAALGRLVAQDPGDQDRAALARRLVVVENTVLQDLTRRATTVTARIVLNPETKTSSNLWYEETLPPDSLFAAVIARRPGADQSAVDRLVDHLKQDDRHTQIGGNAGVGCGWCRWVVSPSPGVWA